MHKRARNHKILISTQKYNKIIVRGNRPCQLLKRAIKATRYKNYNKFGYLYEPQGKREAKKYIHAPGLLQFVPSTFKDDEISEFFKQFGKH